MPTNRPNKIELVEAVREFLENRIQPTVEGQVSLHTRIAVNILKMVERELALGPNLEKEEWKRLRALLGEEGTLEELNATLCQKLRCGEMDYRNKELIEHLRLSALGRLSIDNPEYSAYRRSVEKEPGGKPNAH
jgi:hypothetical protein